MKLRPYQTEQVRRVMQALKRSNAVMLQSPVGTGKTRMGVKVVKKTGVETLWLAHTRELVSQADEALPSNVEVMTIHKAHKFGCLPWINLIVIDECHRTMGGSEDGMYRALLRANPQAKVLGLTATPLRADGKPLLRKHGGVYDELVLGKSVKWHCDNGTTMAPKHFTSPVSIEDLKILQAHRSAGGDYNMRDASQKMTTSVLCGDVVAHYKRLALGRQAVVFACDLTHAKALAKRFNDELGADIARIVCGNNAPEVRRKTFKDFRTDRLQILVNVNIITEGWDYPELGIAILARPTRSRTLFIQMVGRVMRYAPGKKQPLILDHGGIFHEHGQVVDDFDWAEGRAKSPAYIKCPSCGYVLPRNAPFCTHCKMGLTMAGRERKRYERRSSIEEMNHKLVLAEELQQRRRDRTPKPLAPRKRDPEWVPMTSPRVTPETQSKIYARYLESSRPKIRVIAQEFDVGVHIVRIVVCMNTRKSHRDKSREHYQKNRDKIQKRYQKKRAKEPKKARKPLFARRNLDDGWTPINGSPTSIDDQKSMRKLYETSDFSVARIGEMYGVSTLTAWKICSMKTRIKLGERRKEERKQYSLRAAFK